jgi:hypothetical protein
MPDDSGRRKRPSPKSKKPKAKASKNASAKEAKRAAKTTTAGKPRRKRPGGPRITPRRSEGDLSGTITPSVDIAGILDALQPKHPPEFRVPVRRPADLVVFDLVLWNLKLAPGQPPRLVREDPAKAAYLIVELPPQSFGEEAFLDKTGPEDTGQIPPAFPETSTQGPPKNTNTASAEPLPAMPSAKIRMSGLSRIAYSMPDGVAELDFTVDAVMEAMRTWPLHLDAIAAPDESEKATAGSRAGKEWLKGVTSTQNWKFVSNLLSTSLDAQVGTGISRMIGDAASRIADYTANSLVSKTTENLADELDRMMTSELSSISAKYAKLREGLLHDAAVASLALKSTEFLAASPKDFGDDLSFSSALPYLPVMISPHKPADNVTALELPYRLIVSPIETARWLHADEPVTDARSGRTELWHTRLTTAPEDFGPDGPAKIRAIWSPDYPITDFSTLLSPPKPYRMSMDPLDRQMLVKLMAGYNELVTQAPRVSYSPRSSRTHRLTLSALGGLLDSEGGWSPRPLGVGLEQWRHMATLGRDHYVRVVYAGFLMPFGNRASLIKVTERKFESFGDNLNERVAVLRQRFFIVVREPVKTFASAGAAPGWYNFPFTRVEILTRITPNLVDPGDGSCKVDETGGAIYGPSVPRRAAFWPMLSGNFDFRFEAAVHDISGNRATFAMPMLFIGDEANQAVAANVVSGYNKGAADPRRLAPLGGASVCYAPIQSGANGDPRLPTQSITYEAVHATGGVTVPHFHPQLRFAQVGIRQIQRLLGQSQAVVEVEYPEIYKGGGFSGSNAGEIFLKLTSPHELNFGGGQNQAKSDALGALASPAMAIQGMSRIMGPVAAKPPSGGQTVEDALQKVIGNSFDPTDFFKGAKILGGVDLSSILAVVNSLVGNDVPKLVSKEFPDRVEASFKWQTEITKSDPLQLLAPRAGGNATILTMDGRVTAPISNPQAAVFDASAKLTNFKVNLFGFIIIWFDALTFKASRGNKPDVAVDMHPGEDSVTFGGPLEFVNELRKFIPSNGFSDPPNISVTPSGIAAAYSLSLPSIGVGVFTMTNVSLGAGFSLPFDAEPVEVTFNFSERQHPFSLTVSLFGGGGFFALGIGSEGVREIESALEFGAGTSIDLGVASGSVEVKAGVYFHWLESSNAKTVELAGYVRLHGELSVLGLISVSLTFNLQLSYLKEGSKGTVWGEATLVIEVEVLVFSADVSVRCRKKFSGSPADPTFLDFVPTQPVWAEYCGAFAAE